MVAHMHLEFPIIVYLCSLARRSLIP